MGIADEAKLEASALIKKLREQATRGKFPAGTATKVRRAAETVKAQATTPAQECSAGAYAARVECQLDRLQERARERSRLLDARETVAKGYKALKAAKTVRGVAEITQWLLPAASVAGVLEAAKRRVKAAETRVGRAYARWIKNDGVRWVRLKGKRVGRTVGMGLARKPSWQAYLGAGDGILIGTFDTEKEAAAEVLTKAREQAATDATRERYRQEGNKRRAQEEAGREEKRAKAASVPAVFLEPGNRVLLRRRGKETWRTVRAATAQTSQSASQSGAAVGYRMFVRFAGLGGEYRANLRDGEARAFSKVGAEPPVVYQVVGYSLAGQVRHVRKNIVLND